LRRALPRREHTAEARNYVQTGRRLEIDIINRAD
jgi:hypothetical protein